MIDMWPKMNHFVRTHAVLSAFLLTVLFMLPIMAAGLSLMVGMGQMKGLPIFTACQIGLSAACIFLMRKLEVFDKSDFGFKNVGKGLLLGWIVYVFAIIMFAISLSSPPEGGYIAPNPLFLIMVILAPFIGTGLFEETLCRGLVLKTLLQKMGDTKKGMIAACVISAVLFGVAHLANLTWVAPLSVIPQVFFATASGIFLGAIYLRTKTLIAPILLHGINNVFTQILDAFTSPDFISQRDAAASANVMEVAVTTLIIVTLYLIPAFVLLRKVKPAEIAGEQPGEIIR